jgi:hypothetical protein
MPGAGGTKIVIRTSEGRYLSGSGDGLHLVNDIYRAVMLDPAEFQVEETLLELRKVTGLVFEALPLKLEEVFETCDICEQMLIPIMTFFNGRNFLCQKCRKAGLGGAPA